jgi:hypothetical protein
MRNSHPYRNANGILALAHREHNPRKRPWAPQHSRRQLSEGFGTADLMETSAVLIACAAVLPGSSPSRTISRPLSRRCCPVACGRPPALSSRWHGGPRATPWHGVGQSGQRGAGRPQARAPTGARWQGMGRRGWWQWPVDSVCAPAQCSSLPTAFPQCGRLRHSLSTS